MQIYFTGTKPIFEEIVEQISLYIEKGIMKPGDKLPSVRELAVSLAINPNTVMRAYLALTEKGLLVSLPKKGIYVAGEEGEEKRSTTFVKETLERLLAAGYTVSDIEETLNQIKEGEKK